MDQLRKLVLGEDPAFQSDRTLDDMVHALQYGGGYTPPGPLDNDFPDDVLVQSFPGGDYEGLPQDLLVQVEGRWEPKWSKNCVAPGMFVFVRAPSGARVNDTPFLFSWGAYFQTTDRANLGKSWCSGGCRFLINKLPLKRVRNR